MEFDHVSISYLDLSRVLQGMPRRNAKTSFGELMREARQSFGNYWCQSSFHAAFFNIDTWSGAMERERDEIDCIDLAGIWRNAEQRRAEDVGAWLRRVIERYRQKASEADGSYPQGKPILR